MTFTKIHDIFISMTELYQINDSLYEVHSTYSSHGIETNLVGLFTYLTHSLQFHPNEIEKALLDMLNKNNDSAHFDRNNKFMYSFIKIQKYGKAS